MENYPKEFLELLYSVKAKRPKTVIEHILQYGYITSEELKDIYMDTIIRREQFVMYVNWEFR